MNSGEESNEFWERITPDRALTEKSIALAKRDLNTAKNILQDGDYDWCFAVSYNSMLQAARALMFSSGYRPKAQEGHLAAIEFVRIKHQKDFSEGLLFLFNKMRKKRHATVYEETNLISPEEAEHALETAKKFVRKIEGMISAKPS